MHRTLLGIVPLVTGVLAVVTSWRTLPSGLMFGPHGAWQWGPEGPGDGLRITALLLVIVGATLAWRLARVPALLVTALAVLSAGAVLEQGQRKGFGFTSYSPLPSHLGFHQGPAEGWAIATAVLVLALALRPRPDDPAPADPDGHP